ncbi:dehydrogenase [Streptomyces sp. NRRL F-2747]|uniref:dehydrogenase n=1 Tax=Streptomyces sp. NRRL F-2747 TaxID=1463843 RepID=UPI00099D67E8|nr:dehydrogenase [Streptomyces sp. NRRL F-2747]
MSSPPLCPQCGQPMKTRGLALYRREEDDQRACRALWQCPEKLIWWHWADRPDEPMELCPTPRLFGG